LFCRIIHEAVSLVDAKSISQLPDIFDEWSAICRKTGDTLEKICRQHENQGSRIVRELEKNPKSFYI
jgi:hypothetical protein